MNLMFQCTPYPYLVMISIFPLCHIDCVVQVYKILNLESDNSGRFDMHIVVLVDYYWLVFICNFIEIQSDTSRLCKPSIVGCYYIMVIFLKLSAD